MKQLATLMLLCAATLNSYAQTTTQWKPAEGRISTPWAAKVNPAAPLPEYPRPQLVRNTWMNLNGLWDYSLLPQGGDARPANFDGKILVPFAVESSLSGVAKTVGKDSVLWYRRTVTLPRNFNGQKVLLHFGAVDWQADVYVNGKPAGTHKGGYDPFSFDITPHLKRGQQEIVVRVWDPSDDGPQPRGKQVKRPHGIWYTPVTGIWQTVWLEAVPQTYISETKQTPDFDSKQVTVQAQVAGAQASDVVQVSVMAGGAEVAKGQGSPGSDITITVPNGRAWSPKDPFLYDLKYTVLRNGRKLDEAKSYFALRKVSMAPDAAGIQRMLLNNEFVFHFGPLDQGWWPDGLYTAPTDEALKYDIEQTLAMGFNTIRKHVKTEPARWYRYCDEMGVLVWQDMPSGDLGARWESRPGIVGLGRDMERKPESEQIFRTEWAEIMKDLHNFPSIVVWVPFNEAWGQFKTAELVEWTVKQDPSRLVNGASGGNFTTTGHIMDLHNYPEPAMPDPKIYGAKQAIVLGEYGGLGLPLEGHTWQDKNNWGYQNFKNKEELYQRYAAFIDRIPALIRNGLSGAIYTQTTDVEIETNGLMTYDRQVMKIPAEQLKGITQKLYDASLVRLKQ
ncbi:glycoside hydrolase family 2 protein [Paracnuella aquatica]|uniref:glycoside hydrolase family 2 protein n=1 Tax=Paracnuella aquatica TaxID=2268757 RepID=UPI000DEFB2AA|nr:sugar-binding domain-containing protein [Paracnuella aquatica]RPD50691.1 beta-galactosidase [Paracnuella aquatica]